jgi:GT2 family glycosyltransferase
LAFQIARGEYYLLLNTDTILSSSPKAMVDFMENTKDAGIVGAKLVFGDGRVQKSCWRYPNFILQWWYFSVDILYGIFPLVSGLKYRGINYNKCSVVDCISGNGMLLRSEILKKIKGFDCSIFMYFEDTDFCHRLNKIKQFKVYYYPEYSIIHYHGKSSPKSKATLWSYQSYLYLLQKNSKPKFVQFFHLLCKCSWSTEILLLSITKKFFNNPTIEKKIDLLKILNDVKVC